MMKSEKLTPFSAFTRGIMMDQLTCAVTIVNRKSRNLIDCTLGSSEFRWA